jgi:hypothetical protein
MTGDSLPPTPIPSPTMPRTSGLVGDDLFAAAAEERLARQAPLAARLRPRSLDDIVGQDELVGQGRPLRVLVESDQPGPGVVHLATAP